MIARLPHYVVMLDACVLVPMPLCHTLLNLAEEPALYIPKWSNIVLDETGRALRKMGRSNDQVERRLKAMRTSFEDALVSDYEGLIVAMENHLGDRHVLAAAVSGGAHAIVTHNVRHFPKASTEKYGVHVLTPDEFLCERFHSEPAIVVRAIERQAQDISTSVSTVLERLMPAVPRFVSLVGKYEV